jgi:hypothetical protein
MDIGWCAKASGHSGPTTASSVFRATGDKDITHDPTGLSYDEGFVLRFNK